MLQCNFKAIEEAYMCNAWLSHDLMSFIWQLMAVKCQCLELPDSDSCRSWKHINYSIYQFTFFSQHMNCLYSLWKLQIWVTRWTQRTNAKQILVPTSSKPHCSDYWSLTSYSYMLSSYRFSSLNVFNGPLYSETHVRASFEWIHD